MSQIIDVCEIAKRYKITTLNTAAWRATRLHKQETKEENERHGTGDAAKVLLRLTNHEALQAIYKLHARAHHEHRRLTVPSVQDGMRLVPAGREFNHSNVMAEYAERTEKLIEAFITDYPSERAAAKMRLNGLWDESMWPDEDHIREKFGFWVRYLACPTDGEWKEWLDESARAADLEVRERIEESLRRVAERCGNLEGRLFRSVFTNLRELVDLVPDLDVFGKYKDVVKEARELANYDAEEVKDDADTRKEISKRAEELLGIFGNLR